MREVFKQITLSVQFFQPGRVIAAQARPEDMKMSAGDHGYGVQLEIVNLPDYSEQVFLDSISSQVF